MTESHSPAMNFAASLLCALTHGGVRDIVLCPGSRSQALALAAAAMEQQGLVRLHVRVDERSAGFFALGLSLESGVPTVIITTSGTAVANLHPAVLEAHHSLVPLIVLSADRPESLRGIRSSQTTDQAHLYKDAVRWSVDHPAPEGATHELEQALTLARRSLTSALGTKSRNPGPVQLNLAFVEPLSGKVPDMTRMLELVAAGVVAEVASEVAAGGRSEHYILDHSLRTVVVAGSGAGPTAEAFAQKAGVPLLAEVASGARFGREVIANYRELLNEPGFGDEIERVIVFGHPTLSREVPQLIQRDGVETVVIAPSGTETYNPGHRVRAVAREATLAEDYNPSLGRPWLGKWVVTGRALLAETTTVHEPDLTAARETGYKERSAYARAELAAMREPVTRGLLCEAVWRATWPHDRLVLGASRLVRVLDQIAPGRNIKVFANRGLAGIDGTTATALGIASSSQDGESPGVTRLIVGDLTFLHDVGSLLLPQGEPQPRIQIFVGNDGGGTIFDGLEVAGTAPSDLFDRVMFTPHNVEIRSLADAYGWQYTRVTTRGELDALLTAPVVGPSIVEVPLAR